jgi:tRNA(adenine34) deaminase
MQAALAQAQLAGDAGEVPVGAVVVHNGKVIGIGRNAPIHTHDPSAHAEIAALRAAARHLGNYRLEGCELFVTLEPCTMCAGAMLHARLQRVVFGAADPKTGAAGSVTNIFSVPQLNHHTQVQGGVMAEPCAALLQDFFMRQRAQQQLERSQAGRALRDDALRTPDACFHTLPEMPAPSCFLSDLPSLAGLRLHYVDTGPSDATECFLCLHDSKSWSYGWRGLVIEVSAKGQRVVCPDLIGFGKSDKPKKESFHTRHKHAQVLLELIEHLDLSNITLVVPDNEALLTQQLLAGAPQRFAKVMPMSPDALSPAALAAPFPDAGHTAALRALARL